MRIIALIITALMLLIVAMSATPNITGGCKNDTTDIKKELKK